MIIVYCLHGDEVETEKIATQMKKELGIKIILGNPKARRKIVRFIESDLNRSFNKKGTYETERAQEIINLIKDSKELIIDLHTTSAEMPPVAIITDLKQLKLVGKTGIKNIIYMNREFSTGGSLIENVRNGFSIEFTPDKVSSQNVKFFIKNALEGSLINHQFQVNEVTEIVKGKHDPNIQNFKILPDGTYPVFSGEKAYKGIKFLRTKKRDIIL